MSRGNGSAGRTRKTTSAVGAERPVLRASARGRSNSDGAPIGDSAITYAGTKGAGLFRTREGSEDGQRKTGRTAAASHACSIGFYGHAAEAASARAQARRGFRRVSTGSVTPAVVEKACGATYFGGS